MTHRPARPPWPSVRAIPGINLPGLGVVAVGPMEGKGGSPTLATPKFAVTQAMTAPVTTTGQTTIVAPGVPLIDTNEFLFLQALGHVNSKSTFRAITSDSSVHFGTSHKLTGDVDDSGCVDHADFAEVTQKDIYHQRAVLPLELATRADLNHDGWVTKLPTRPSSLPTGDTAASTGQVSPRRCRSSNNRASHAVLTHAAAGPGLWRPGIRAAGPGALPVMGRAQGVLDGRCGSIRA